MTTQKRFSMTERTLCVVQNRLRPAGAAAGSAAAHRDRASELTYPALLGLRSRGGRSRRSRRLAGRCGRRRRARTGRSLVILKIRRVLELVFRPRHFQLDHGRVVRVAGRRIVLIAGVGGHDVERAHVNGDVLRTNTKEPAYAYDHANNLSALVK